MVGTVRRLSVRGFGFITAADVDRWFHCKDVLGSFDNDLHIGQRVQFDEEYRERDGVGKIVAVRVRPV